MPAMDEQVSLPVLAVGVVLKDVVGVHGGCTQPVGTNVQILSPRQAADLEQVYSPVEGGRLAAAGGLVTSV